MALPVTITGISTAVASVGPFKVAAGTTYPIADISTGAAGGIIGELFTTTNPAYGQVFTNGGSALTIHSATAGFFHTSGTVTASIYAEITQTDCAGAVLTTSSLVPESLVTATTAATANTITFTFPTPITLAASATFGVVFRRTAYTDAATVAVRSLSAGTYPGGGAWRYSTASGTWNVTDAAYDLDVSIYRQGVVASDAYYFFGRDGTTATTLQAYKSTAPDTSWASQTTKTGFTTAILNIAACQSGTTIHLLVQDGTASTSLATKYVSYNALTDTFLATTETVSAAVAVTGQIAGAGAGASLVVRSDGSVVCFYSGVQTKTSGTFRARVYHRNRTGLNTYGAETEVDANTAIDNNNPVAVLGASDRAHLLFFNQTNTIQRHLTGANTLGTAASTGATTAVQDASAFDNAGTIRHAAFTAAQAVRWASADNPTVTAASVTFGTPVRTVDDGTDVYALYQSSADSDLYIKKSTDFGATFGTAISAFVGTVASAAANLSKNQTAYQRGFAIVFPYIVNDNGTLKYNEYTIRTLTPTAASSIGGAGAVTVNATVFLDPIKYGAATLGGVGGRANYVRNPRAEGAVAGTPGTLPTFWTGWGSGTANGLTESIIGTGVEDGIPYIDVRWFGTSFGNNILPRFFEPVGTSGISSGRADTWTLSFYARVVGGTTNNLLYLQIGWSEYDSGGTKITGRNQNNTIPTTAPLSSQRVNVHGRNFDPPTQFVSPSVGVQLTTSAVTVDVTLRIGAPQFERGDDPSDLILPPVGSPGVTQRAIQIHEQLYLAAKATIGGAGSVGVDAAVVAGLGVIQGGLGDPALDSDTVLLLHMDRLGADTTLFKDHSLSAHTITTNSISQATTATSKFGGGSLWVPFSGSGLTVTGAVSDFQFGAGPFTVEAWVYFSATTSALNPIAGQGPTGFAGTDMGWEIFVSSSAIYLYYSTTGTDTNSTSAATSIPNDTWTQVVVERDASNNVRFYLNGAVLRTVTVAATLYPSTRNLLVGNTYSLVSNFPGYIDELRISKVARYAGAFTPQARAFRDTTTPAIGIEELPDTINAHADVLGVVEGVLGHVYPDADTVLLLHADLIGGSTTTFFDYSRSGHPMSAVSGAVIDFSTVKFGTGSISFPSNTSYVEAQGTVSDFQFGAGAFTIEAWVFPDADPSGNAATIFAQSGASPNYGYLFYWDGTYLNLLRSANGTTYTVRFAAVTLTLNSWSHVAVERTSGGDLRFYLNGNVLGSVQYEPASFFPAPVNASIGNIIGDTSYWRGFIDEVRVSRVARYGGAFTPAEEPFAGEGATFLLEAPDTLSAAGDVVTGAVTQTASVTINGTGGLQAFARLGLRAATTIGGVGTLLANALPGRPAATTIAGTGTVVVSAVVLARAATTIAGLATVSAAALPLRPAAAAIGGIGTLTVSAAVQTRAQATIAAQGSVAVDSTPLGLALASTRIDGQGTVTASARRITFAAITIAGQATVAVDSSALGLALGAATIAGQGGIAIDARRVTPAAIAITGQGTITATASVSQTATVTITGLGTVASDARRISPAAAAIAGQGTTTIDVTQRRIAAATIGGVGTVLAGALPSGFTGAGIAGQGAVTVSAVVRARAAVTIAGEGSVSGTLAGITATATVTGQGTVSVTAGAREFTATSIAGQGSVTADALPLRPAASVLAGQGTVTIDGRPMRAATATISGQGAVGVTAEVLRAAAGDTIIAGRGTVSVSANVVASTAVRIDGKGIPGTIASLRQLVSAIITGSGDVDIDAGGEGFSGTEIAGLGEVAVNARVMASKSEIRVMMIA